MRKVVTDGTSSIPGGLGLGPRRGGDIGVVDSVARQAHTGVADYSVAIATRVCEMRRQVRTFQLGELCAKPAGRPHRCCVAETADTSARRVIDGSRQWLKP